MRSMRPGPTPVLMVTIAAALAISGCGGGGGTPSPPIAVAPAPSPSPSPSPTPTPTLTPTPTPTPGPTFAGATPGQTLQGLMSCAQAEVTRDAQGRVKGLPTLPSAQIDNLIALTFRATDSYALDVNGFGGSSFTVADKRASPVAAYDQFLNSTQGELFVFRDGSAGAATFAALGLDNSSGLCFFGVGLPAIALPTSGTGDYGLRIDGIAGSGAQAQRLFGTDGSFTVNYASNSATVILRLAGRPNPFGDFLAQPATAITTASAAFTLQNGNTGLIPLTGTNGYSGTIIAKLVGNTANTSGNGGSGAVLVFELRNAQGNTIFGAVAAERNLI